MVGIGFRNTVYEEEYPYPANPYTHPLSLWVEVGGGKVGDSSANMYNQVDGTGKHSYQHVTASELQICICQFYLLKMMPHKEYTLHKEFMEIV
jgi:hypothetical protein